MRRRRIEGNRRCRRAWPRPTGSNGAIPSPPANDAPPRRVAKLVGSELRVNDRPTFPRVIQHRGESLSLLKQLGFNIVWLQRLPAPEVLEEADRLGLWLICPAPRALTPIAEIGPAFDPVLAWDLGNDLTDADLEPARQWAEQVRAADHRGNRPLVCCPRVDLSRYSRLADILLIDRRPLGTSLELKDYATWVSRRPLLARAGTPIWTTIQTQHNEASAPAASGVGARLGAAALRVARTNPPVGLHGRGVGEPGARVPVRFAARRARRGDAATGDGPGTAQPGTASDRALGGRRNRRRRRGVARAGTAPCARNSASAQAEPGLPGQLRPQGPLSRAPERPRVQAQPRAPEQPGMQEVVGTVLRTEHARLLLPIWLAPGAQCVPPQSAANAVSLVAPGVPEVNSAYELTPGGVQELRRKRVAGGMSVTLEEFGLTAQVLFAHDPLVVGAVNGLRGRSVLRGRVAASPGGV